jgi:hypothetical protein
MKNWLQATYCKEGQNSLPLWDWTPSHSEEPNFTTLVQNSTLGREMLLFTFTQYFQIYKAKMTVI